VDNLTFVIYKKTKWIVESTNGSKIEKTEHGSLRQGIVSLFGRHSNVILFHFTIPATDTTDTQDFIVQKLAYRKWLMDLREYSSQAKAINGFLHSHPGLPMFYISIPIEQCVKSL
jgi:hypothetical protein